MHKNISVYIFIHHARIYIHISKNIKIYARYIKTDDV